MEKIIVDTSSILFGLSKKTNVLSSVREVLGLSPVISRGVVWELSQLSKKKGPRQKYARIAIALVGSSKVEIRDDEEYVDKWILNASKEIGKVCTNDTGLRQELRRRKVSVYSVAADGTIR